MPDDMPFTTQPFRLHGLIAEILRSRRIRVINDSRNVMRTSRYLREHHLPNVYPGVMH